MLENLPQVLHFRRHQQSGGCLFHVMDDPLGRGVGAVRRTERIIHVHVRERRQLFRKSAVVLFFLRVEPEVLEQHHLAAPRRPIDRRARGVTDAVLGKLDRTAEKLGEPGGDRLQGVLGIGFAFRPPEMRRQDDRGALVECVIDRRQRRADASVVGNRAVLDRHVEVHADEDARAGEIEIGNAPRQLRAPS